MRKLKIALLGLVALACVFVVGGCVSSRSAVAEENLSAWQVSPQSPAIKIVDFVERAKQIYPPEKRIAVFDMDGTLICERPVIAESYFAAGIMGKRLEEDATLINEPYYKDVYKLLCDNFDNKACIERLQSDMLGWWLQAFKGINELDLISYVKINKDKFRHPEKKLVLSDTFYKPMLQLIDYLEENGFKVYVVSGSSTAIVRGMCHKILNLPPERFIGTEDALVPVFYKDKPAAFERVARVVAPRTLQDGKVTNYYAQVGVQPVLAVGNSVDDFSLLQYTCSGNSAKTPRLGVMINHDDDVREYQYPGYYEDTVPVRLPGATKPVEMDTKKTAWEFVKANDWLVISMKNDFKEIFESPKAR